MNGDWLCRTCYFSQILKGHAQSEEAVFCHFWSDMPWRPPFKVRECNEYQDRRLPDRRDLEEIAWILLTKRAGKSVGFVTAKDFKKIEGEDAQILP